ncbi:MAG: hypothetical protein ACXVCK_02010 [Bdellovibrionota bacterium]
MYSVLLDPLPNHQARFRSLAPRICDLLFLEGIEAMPWHDPQLPFFSAMDSARRTALLHSLEAQLEAFERCRAQGESLDNPWASLAIFLELMNLQMAPDLAQFAGPDDYVAVYDRFQGMIFLSPNHLRGITYSLEDLYCRLWISLFRRDQKIEKILMERVFPFAHDQRMHTMSNEDIPPHIISETQSPGLRAVTVESKVYSPLFQKGSPAGFLSVNHAVRPVSRFLPKPFGLMRNQEQRPRA